jgi:hypothetical protein
MVSSPTSDPYAAVLDLGSCNVVVRATLTASIVLMGDHPCQTIGQLDFDCEVGHGCQVVFCTSDCLMSENVHEMNVVSNTTLREILTVIWIESGAVVFGWDAGFYSTHPHLDCHAFANCSKSVKRRKQYNIISLTC